MELGRASLPADWDVVHLGDVGDAVIGLTYNLSEVAPHGTLVLRSSNIQEGALSFEDNVHVRKTVPPELRTREGDILICVRNGSRDLIGKCVQLDRRVDGMTFGAFMAVFRSPEHRYVYHQLRSGWIRRQIRECLGATINQITNANLRAFSIPFPRDPGERELIAEALDDADRLVVELSALVAKMRDAKTAAVRSLLSGRSRLPGYERRWQATTMGKLLRVRHGKSQRGVVATDGPYPILASGGQIGRASQAIYDRPSVLIGRKGTIDAPQYMETPFWSIDTLFFTEIAANVDPKFVFYLFQTVHWRSFNEASGVPSLSAATIESIDVTVPEQVEEQRAIAAMLSEMDVEIDAVEARLAKTRDLRSAMAEDLLSGRTRLT